MVAWQQERPSVRLESVCNSFLTQPWSGERFRRIDDTCLEEQSKTIKGT